MRYTVIDGRSYEVRECAECPFRDMGDGGWGAHCTHPLASQDPRAPLEIAFDGRIAEGCPLRASGKWPCPFCGSFRQKEVYIDDTGEILEEWMMDEVNKGMDENDQYMTLQEFYDAAACHFLIQCTICGCNIESPISIKDAWAKWNMRVGP